MDTHNDLQEEGGQASEDEHEEVGKGLWIWGLSMVSMMSWVIWVMSVVDNDLQQEDRQARIRLILTSKRKTGRPARTSMRK